MRVFADSQLFSPDGLDKAGVEPLVELVTHLRLKPDSSVLMELCRLQRQATVTLSGDRLVTGLVTTMLRLAPGCRSK